MSKVPSSELQSRLARLRTRMDQTTPDWEMVAIFSKINLYYLTGTMQEGMLLITREGDATFWVRRSIERAVDESEFPNIKPMNSYRDAAVAYTSFPTTIHLETEFVPLAMYTRFQKYFPATSYKSVDTQIGYVRSIKSTYELDLMIQSGKIHQRVLEELVPTIMREGMSEAEMAMEIYQLLVSEGHQGISRFAMFDTEMIFGHLAFGESSLYPTSFNGPGGNYGMYPAVPSLGSRIRLLKKGDLVFVDIGCGFHGYHTDKTMTYSFGKAQSQEVIDAQHQCVEIQNTIASMLKPGAIPSQIFENVMNSISPQFMNNFMGFGKRQVKFLGHGIGLTIDETPVLAAGFDEPIVEGMAFAVEPKKGIEKVGMVGIENTFLVTPSGGRCITGENKGLINVF